MAMRHSGVGIPLTSLNMTCEEHRRLVIYAVVVAIVIHGLTIWFLLNRSTHQPLPLPKQRIEVNLVMPQHSAAMPVPVVTPPVPPKVQPTIIPPPPPVPAKHSEAPVERPVEPVARPAPIAKPDSTPSAAETAKLAEPSQPASVVVPQPSSEPKSEPISPPGFDAAYLNNPRPVYPAAARRMGLEGLVTLRVKVDPHGKPEDVKVLTSSGSSILDKSAMEIVLQQWMFVPARQGDHPVSGVVDIPIRFSLR